jgi:hypothetical protein
MLYFSFQSTAHSLACHCSDVTVRSQNMPSSHAVLLSLIQPPSHPLTHLSRLFIWCFTSPRVCLIATTAPA